MSAEQAEKLRAVRELLADETRWTSDCLARDAQGLALDDPNAAAATSWCLVGALEKLGGETTGLPELLVAAGSSAGLDPGGVLTCSTVTTELDALENFNDSRGHREVIALLDLGIAAATVKP